MGTVVGNRTCTAEAGGVAFVSGHADATALCRIWERQYGSDSASSVLSALVRMRRRRDFVGQRVLKSNNEKRGSNPLCLQGDIFIAALLYLLKGQLSHSPAGPPSCSSSYSPAYSATGMFLTEYACFPNRATCAPVLCDSCITIAG